MRKRIGFVLCVILLLSVFPAAQSALAAGEEYSIIRVKLSVEESSSLSFFVDGNYTIGSSTTAIERQQYTVKLEGGSLNMYYGSAKVAGGSSIKLVQRAATSGRNNFIWLYNARYETSLKYLGNLEFRIDSANSCIEVINQLYIEDYLYGVVPWEMNNSFPIEALKAQAVAARNYAERHINASASYDVVDTTKNQVYRGYDPSATNAIQAVDATAGRVLTYKKEGKDAEIVEVFYSASNGGYTEIPQHFWTASNPLYPYHVIQADPYDVQNPYSKQDILILPKSVTESEGIAYAYSDDKGGQVSVTAPGSSEIVNAIAYLKDTALPSATTMGYSSIDAITGVTGITAHTLKTQHDILDYNGQGCVCFTKADITMTALATRAGTADEQAAGQPTVQEPITVSFTIDMTKLADEDGGYFVFDEHPTLGLFTVEETETIWRICHRRFGQGVGLSQRGAEQRAKSGQTYQEILSFYYPGTELTTQTYGRPGLTAVTLTDHSNAFVKLTDSTPLNVRSGAGTSYSKLGNLPDRARIQVVQASAATGNGYTWHKILFGGQYAYVAINYVQLDSYTISYNLNGGTATNPASYTMSDTITLTNPTKPGYSFTGWTGTGLSAASMNVTIPAGSTGNREYTANWSNTVSTVTFDAQGGSSVASVQKNPGEPINTSPATTRPGYTFGGWYPTSACNTAPVSFPYTVTGSVTLYAKWVAQPQTAYLSSVSFSAGTLSKVFSRTSYSYKLSLGEYQDSVTITPLRENETATMTINGKAVSSYSVTLANGKSTTVTVKVKFGKTSKTYTFSVSRAKSTNNNLATLTATAGTFDRAFDPAVTSYTLTLDEFTKSTKIYDTVATSLAGASFRSKTVTLSNGQTTKVALTVKAQSGAKKIYTITVKRAPSTNTSLKYLKTSSSSCPLTPAFNPGVTNYTITLPSNRSYVTISASTLGYKAAVYFDGSKRSSKKVTLAHGQSVTIHITVVAQAGNTVDYYITVTRL